MVAAVRLAETMLTNLNANDDQPNNNNANDNSRETDVDGDNSVNSDTGDDTSVSSDDESYDYGVELMTKYWKS